MLAQNSSNAIGKVRNWYNGQVNRAEAQQSQQAKERFQTEIKKFEDTFDSVASLDGTPSDKDENPGEVKTGGGVLGLLSGTKSLKKTDEGFALKVSTGTTGGAIAVGLAALNTPNTPPGGLYGSPSVQLSQDTEYQVNEKTGTIAVTRNTLSGNALSRRTTQESFTLDTLSGEAVDYSSSVLPDDSSLSKDPGGTLLSNPRPRIRKTGGGPYQTPPAVGDAPNHDKPAESPRGKEPSSPHSGQDYLLAKTV